MPTKIIFPYQFKPTSFGTLPDPVIYLVVVTQFGLRKIGFLVDSGSDTVILPLASYGFWFKFTPNPKTKITLGGVEGKGIAAYPGKIRLRIGTDSLPIRCYFVKSDTMPLLGRLDIWDTFNWHFDNRKQKVIFEKIT